MLVETGNFPDYSTASDSMLVDFSLAGDHQAFERLVIRHRERLYHAMLRVAKSAELAEELVQDSFVQAYVKLSTFKRKAAFSSWLFRIAFNKYLGMQRSRVLPTSLDTLEEGSHYQPIDHRDSPEQLAVRFEDRQRVIRALDRLQPKVRRILELREMQGLTYDEIGQVLKLKPGTVRSQLSRARGRLHQELSGANTAAAS